MKVAYAILLFAIFNIIALPLTAQAQDDHAVVMHFDKPVEIPGQVLPAGSYTFVVPESTGGTVVQIFNAKRTHLVATVQAVGAQRLEASDKFEVTLGEGNQSASQALVKWFDAGALNGYELIYPHGEGQQLRASETTVSVRPVDRPVSGD
jgi:hypothetical protein